MEDLWNYRARDQLGSTATDTQADLSGFKVEALDGAVGAIDEATYDVERSYVVVDTGPWIFGTKVMLPAGVIRGIDETEELVFVNRTKDEIKHAPEYDRSNTYDDTYFSSLSGYYGSGGPGYRAWDDVV